MDWVSFHDYQGVRHLGTNHYNPDPPLSEWKKIFGVVARCEGNHDTCVSYDNTGMTWGFLQWTFTSGRLQMLLQSLKAIPSFDASNKEKPKSLFDDVFCESSSQIFSKFGFEIRDGKFFDVSKNVCLSPNNASQKQRISDICMGKVQYDKPQDQKSHALGLARIFSSAGLRSDIAEAQIQYAKWEFKAALPTKRDPLGDIGTIENLLAGTWETCLPAIFFNLWQNSPGGAYKLFINARNSVKDLTPENYLTAVWKRLNVTKYANWSFAKPENKSPRIARIADALKEFYGVDLLVTKKF